MAPPPAAKNFHQHQPITTGLRTICESYPPDTCLRELLQNADDARATVMEYVLDTNSYLDGPLLHECLSEYHGPALLARNNSVFRDEDFASLSSVGDSRKRHDAFSTGKFGQGFNSVYHWTDGPWVYSRKWLLLLDPHERWSVESGQPGGPTWDVVAGQECQEVQNHLKTFQALKLDVSREIDQTIIRIPLRTKAQALTSKIANREIVIKEIKDALDQFGREIRDGGLLFLRHIQMVTVRVNNDVIWEAKILENCLKARGQIPSYFADVFTSVAEQGVKQSSSKPFNFDVAFTMDNISTIYRYLVHHTMTRSSGNKDLDLWARERKLFGWVAVAAPLEHPEIFEGRLFSTLRLPIRTNHPVHIHGLFSITPDRGRLTSSGQSPGSEDFATKWNDFLFASCISSAWAEVLAQRSSASWRVEGFSLWPRVTESPIDQWSRLDNNVIDTLVRKKLPVWPTAKKCVSIQEGLFSVVEPGTVKYASALAEAEVAAVFLERPLFEKLQQRHTGSVCIKWMVPNSVRKELRTKEAPILCKMPRVLSTLLLEFCLLDLQEPSSSSFRVQVYRELDDIGLWPTLDGSLSKSGISNFLLPRDLEEMELFSESRKAETLDLNGLTAPTLDAVHKDMTLDSVGVRYRRLADLAKDWPIIYPLTEPPIVSRNWVLRSLTHKELTIRSIWAWICARLEEEVQLPSELDDLWLLPTNSLRLRRYAPGPEAPPVLMTTESEPLFELANNLVLKDLDMAPPILDAKLLPATAVKLLQRNTRSTPKLRGTCVNDIQGYVAWLYASRELLSTESDEQKRSLMQHLEMLTRNKGSTINNKHMIAIQLRDLPIFTKITSKYPFTKRITTLCGLQCSHSNGSNSSSSTSISNHVFEAPTDLPPIPQITGVSFYDLSKPAEKYLVKRFDLIERISIDNLLKHHLLPWAVSAHDGPSAAAKLGLIEYTFQHLHLCHATKASILDVSNIPIIPLPLSDNDDGRQYRCLSDMISPTSPLSELYFENEEVFPCPQFFERHKETLKVCGIISKPERNTLLDRIQYYSQCGADAASLKAKVKCLLQLPIHKDIGSSKSSIAKIRTLKWLPATPVSDSSLTILSPRECRGSNESDLVDHVLGTIRFSVKPEWKEFLGWNERLDLDVLTRQLESCLTENEHGKVDRVFEYLGSKFGPAEYSALKAKRCILGVRKNYLVPDKAFTASRLLKRYPMEPYLDEVDSNFARRHSKLLLELGVRKELSVQDILNVQALLKDSNQGSLEGSDLNVAISSLEIAAHLSGNEEIAEILIPDRRSVLRPLSDIVYGELNVTETIAAFNFTHPKISADLIQRLGIENSLDRASRLEIEFEDEDEDEYTPRETLSTIISDTLGRYPIDSTFNEFLANADDCDATKISWILDECDSGPYESSALLTTDLQPFQGAALFAYNDGVFSETDFSGFKEIGQGGKSDNVTTTGMFGRGALSMYHFTDVPTLISGGSMLILDPQQELLPKNRHRKHKAGVKISLEAARRLFPDQLTPFDGLCDYAKDLDYYDGTLFRLPFRTAGKKTTLTESVTLVDFTRVKKLLEDYYTNARKALLFLRNIKSISFRVRGKALSGWSVSADRSEETEDDIFWRVKMSAAWENQKSLEEVWRVGTTDIEKSPVDLVNPGRRSRKISECGVAACLSHVVTDQMIFSRLPTPFESRLPISFHASFAITGDRRTIPWEEQQSDASFARWNHWLLTSCIPNFYIDFLKDLAPKLGVATFNFWPSTSDLSSSPLSSIVATAFWERIMDAQHIAYEVYPKEASESALTGFTPMRKRVGGKTRRLHAVISLKSAQFDFLPELVSRKLRPLLNKLCPHLVRPSSKIWQNFKNAEIAQHAITLTPEFFCRLFADEDNCTLLEEFLDKAFKDGGQQNKVDTLERFLQAVVPPAGADSSSLKILEGCRILPKLDGSLGLLTLKSEAKLWTFVATEEEQKLFSFAAHFMVNTNLFRRQLLATSLKLTTNGEIQSIFRNPIEDIVNSSFNIRPLELEDLGMLLAQPESPINPSALPKSCNIWIVQFWTYLNTRLRILSDSKKNDKPETSVTALLSQCGIEDYAVYRYRSNEEWHYITPRQFDDGPYLVEPENKKDFTFCKEIHGLNLVDRLAVPFLLAEKEADLNCSAAFERLVRALSKIEEEMKVPIHRFLSGMLKENSILTLQSALRKYLRTDCVTKPQAPLQRFPVWPSFQPSQLVEVPNYISASEATFCKSSKLLLPWVVKCLGNLVSPETVDSNQVSLKALGIHVLSTTEIWDRAQPYQPEKLGEISTLDYSDFIQELADNNIKPSTAIAPNGRGIFCKASSLYDHEDELFKSAFRTERLTRFLHGNMQSSISLRRYWISLGLRSRGPTEVCRSEDYVQCALAIHGRLQPSVSNQTPEFCQDAQTVAAYVLWDQPTLHYWSDETWQQIARVRMFRVNDDVTKQRLYRQSRMSQLASKKDHCCLLDLGKTDDVRIIWSQLPILKKDPVPILAENLPRRGRPTAVVVYEHLKYLVSHCHQIDDEDLPEYVRDIQASYNYLQENSGFAKDIPDIKGARIFFNIDTTDTDAFSASILEPSLTSANGLCLNSPVDFGVIKVARKFLVPYEKLLKALGCNSVIQPAARVPQGSLNQGLSPMATTIKEALYLRDQRQLIDVVFEAERREKPAHRIFLAAVSDYCKAQFSGEWGDSLAHRATIHIKDMRFLTLSQMVDFAYTGTVDWPQVQDTGDKDEIANKLDELLDLLQGTDRWLMKTLHTMTEDVILGKAAILVRADNVESVRDIAKDTNAQNLVSHCDEFIALNADFVEA